MKKVICLLMLVALATPAFAQDVTFTATDAGSGQLQIAYSNADPCNPRGIALKITLDNGATCGPTDVVSSDAAFNTFMDYAWVDPCSYAVGDGHPLADAAAAGPLAAAASTFSVCMGVLDTASNQAAGPASTTNLITLQLAGTGSTNVTIEADTLRGPDSGVVGSALTSNLPINTVVAFAPAYPDAWDYPGQCLGDATGDGVVNTSDWPAYRDSFFKSYCTHPPVDMNNPTTAEYNPAADYNRDGAVNTTDWPFYRDNFFKAVSGCTPGGVWPPVCP